MATDVRIEQLGAADVARMREVLAVFAAAFDDDDAYLRRQPGDAYLTRLLGRESFIALAAVDGCGAIGGLAAYELVKFEQARSEIYVYDLAVARSHRRRGIARAMIERLREIAVDRRAWTIFVQADHGDDAAIALYASLGMREDVLHFDITPRRRTDRVPCD